MYSYTNLGIRGKVKVIHMSLILIGRDTLPVSKRGAEGALSVRVADNGQIGFSTSAGKVFENYTNCKIDWDGEGRKMIFTPVNMQKLPKNLKAENTFKVGMSKDGKNRYIAGSGLLKHEAVDYDYSVGSYSFDAVLENGSLSFVLPKEMAKKPPSTRKPRAPKASSAAAGTSTGAQGSAAAGGPVAVDELEEA